eukprot:TRINITY_DN21153_c0_g1_i2.p1 TRINITY_DN21153_c0_g1~~TRINITY_DN21153_c0_g1_i2.p1  ORF type:complete len:106 (-),score=14.15 TRINITY_DN21153_c0_g1_i2:112-429(-)
MDVSNNFVNEGVEIFGNDPFLLICIIVGLCDKQLACTTCSVHVKTKYENLPSPSEEEKDVLSGLKDYVDGQTRMSCQIKIVPELEGMVVQIPNKINYTSELKLNN